MSAAQPWFASCLRSWYPHWRITSESCLTFSTLALGEPWGAGSFYKVNQQPTETEEEPGFSFIEDETRDRRFQRSGRDHEHAVSSYQLGDEDHSALFEFKSIAIEEDGYRTRLFPR